MRSWRWYLGFLAVAAVLAGMLAPLPDAGSGARAQARGGDLHRGMVEVEGKQVPLPPGEWQIAGRAVAAAGEATAGHTVVSVALVRLRGVAVDAAVLVQTNRLDGDAAWGKATACERSDLYFARVRYESDHDGSCAYAAYVVPAARYEEVDPAWKQALLHGAGSGWRFPSHWVEAAYRISDPRDAVQVRYLFDPAGDEGKVSEAEIHALVGWTEANWYAVGSGFRNRLGEDAGLPDWRRSAEAGGAELPQVGAETNQVEHLGAKMVTYRFFGTMTDMSVNYLWLGSLPSAGGLALVSAIASSALYFVHELVWSRFEKPPALVGDLPGVGLEGPGGRK